MQDMSSRSVFELRQFVNKTLLVLILVLFFGLRLPGLGKDLTNSDGPRWHRRSEKFLTALKTGNYLSTYQHYQPGITLMWVNSVVKQFAFWYQFLYTEVPKTLENADWYPTVHGISKGVIVVVLGLVLLSQIYFIRKIFSVEVSLLYGFFMAIEPYVLGIDRWFHLTSLEVYFGFASFLSILVWLKFGASVMDGPFKEWLRNNKFLLISATFFSLSVLSKLTSLILSPLFAVIFISAYLLRFKIIKNCEKDVINFSYVVKDLTRFVILFVVPFFLVFLFVFFIFFPALWIDPFMVFIKFYNAITNAVGDDVRSLQLVGMNPYLYYLLILAFKLSPITLFVGLIALAFSKKILRFGYANYIYLYLFGYYAFLTFADKKIDRYTLVLIPPMLLVISIFVSSFGKKLLTLTLFLSFSFAIWLCVKYYPVYSAYYSPIVGGMKKALDVGIYENSGEYFAQAASYLNSQGRDQNTFVPHGVESFSYYYKGNLQRSLEDTTNFMVVSYDIDRKLPMGEGKCSQLDQTFGPRKVSLFSTEPDSVVYVYWCGRLKEQ